MTMGDRPAVSAGIADLIGQGRVVERLWAALASFDEA